MNTMWKLFSGDVRRITSNVVSIIIALGLVVIPGIFTWFNVAASWDPFSNTKNLKFAIANVDQGYKGDLIPIRITVGAQVVNELRTNSQLDWTFTSKDDAIDGTKSGKYYAAVIIPNNFSKNMMTFFSHDAHHAKLTYYNNEKLNALAPKVTGQGADQVAEQINQMFAKTMTQTALDIASQLLDDLSKPEAKKLLDNFSGNIADFAGELSQTAITLDSFSSLSGGAQSLFSSSKELIGSVSGRADKAYTDLGATKGGIADIASALSKTSKSLADALAASSASYDAVGKNIDTSFTTAGTTVNDTVASLKHQATLVSRQADEIQKIRDDLAQITGTNTITGALDKVIALQRRISQSLNQTAQKLSDKNADTQQQHQEIKDLTNQAKTSINGIKTDFNSTLKPQIDQVISSFELTMGTLNSGARQLKGSLADLDKTTDTTNNDLVKLSQVLSSMSQLLNTTSARLTDFNNKFSAAINNGDMSQIRSILGTDPSILAAPVTIKRQALFPVKSFGTALTPFYTFIPLWVGALLMAITIKIEVSKKARQALTDPKPHQLFLGHFGIFAVIGLLQSSFSCVGTLLFVGVHAMHPVLFVMSGWISSLVYAFFVYTLVAGFGNVGKAIGVIFLVMQISASAGAYPLQVLPDFVSTINPFLPASHSIQAMRAAIAGVYMNDYWKSIGALLLFLPPMVLLGLVLRKPLVKFNRRYTAKLAETKLI